MRSRKTIVYAIIGAVLFLALVGVFYVVLGKLLAPGDGPSSSQTNGSNANGTSLQGSVQGVVGAVTSVSNIHGLTLRINQIDICQLPDAEAYISVADKDGFTVTGLKKGDLSATIDGKKIDNLSFESVSRQPLASTLVLDHSGSMKGQAIEQAKAAAKSFVSASGANDSFAILQFDTSVDVLQARTSDKGRATGAIDGIAPRGNTAIYDALSAAVDNTSDCQRKAIVLLSDGEDTASKSNTQQSVIGKANAANLPIFTVGLVSEGFMPDVLRAIAESTGGQFYEAKTPADLTTVYDKIDKQLKSQYSVAFRAPVTKTGGAHTLRITSNISNSPTYSERQFVY